jgi:acyl-coenzyme A thioesterase PaaI-like protein
VRSGRLHARATPLARGRRSQVWEASVWDEKDRLAASGRVRLICLEEDVPLAGEQVNSRLLPPEI